MQIVVFEDEHVSRLYPITVGKPACAISCATYRLIDWLGALSRETGIVVRGVVRPHLSDVQRLDFPQIGPTVPTAGTPLLLVNARLVPSVGAYRALRQLLHGLETRAVYAGQALAAAMIGPRGPAPPPDDQVDHWHKYLRNSVTGQLPASDVLLPLIDYPHDLIRHNLEQFGESLNHRLSTGSYQEIAPGVFAAEGATLGQYCVTDTSKGPVLLDTGASVGPYCLLRGPAYVGAKSRINEHSAIKDA
ncbi:MAG TPA: putative sugar nucleotidyl transferase, partial [Pirellulaceae bacterium]|nr:putative sugar nucleotidyl transferase [Pirellulaceae bacterium]